ncbi:MAG TPA: Rpn family recombination-promoting nuclease/putative transposase [Telluria sp.]|jgi:hypothetical protein
MTTQQHDLGYRSLFAHPELVRELMADFTPFKLFDALALSAFERVSSIYMSEQLSARQGDIVWRVQVGEQFLYVYILLELQSGVDRWMALRMQTYIGLLHQDLIKQHALSPSLLLPPVLPLVFYNGAPRWSASMELADLLMQAPDELGPFQPSQRYVLIDQQRLDRAALEANSNVLALLFRLELSRFSDVSIEVLPALATWYKDAPQTSLRNSVQQWINALLARETGNPEWLALGSMKEVTEMEGKVGTWAEEIEEIGFQKGCAEGKTAALREVLKCLLGIKFGDVAVQAVPRIEQATQAELERWIERSVTAPSLAALFADDAAPA